MVVVAPPLTKLEEILHPNPLVINFGESAARLEHMGKKVTKGITLSPSVAGDWFWDSDRDLRFQPGHDWPAETKYEIVFDKTLFPDHVRLEKYKHICRTPPFTIAIQNFEFYVDPRDPAIQQAVATLQFSHAVDDVTLEKHINLEMENDESVFPPNLQDRKSFTITYGLHRRLVYVRSLPLKLPKKQGFMKLKIAEGIGAAEGEATTHAALEKVLLIPDFYSFLSVKFMEARIVRKQDQEPEQVLMITTSIPVKSADLAKRLNLYQLPKDKPATENHSLFKDYLWRSPREVTGQILGLAAPVLLELIPGELELATLHSFRFRGDEDFYLYARLKQGLEAPGGFVLKEDFDSVMPVPAWPREIKILHNGALLALSGERKLSFLSRGVPVIEVELARVLPNQIHHLISQSEGNFQSPYFKNYAFGPENLTEVIRERQVMNMPDRAKAVYSSFDFSRHVTKHDDASLQAPALKHGLFFVCAKGWDPGKNKHLDAEDRRLVLLTDLGMVVKDNADGSHEVFVQSIKLGNPVDGVKVAVLGKNGIPVATATTGVDGHASLPTLKDFEKEKQPVAYLARKGDDLSFLPFDRRDRQLNLSRFDTGGIVISEPDALDAFVFSDRGIYRPGETVHAGIVIKRQNWKGPLVGIPLQTDVIDPRGTVLERKNLQLPESGFLEWTWKTRDASPTGTYGFHVYLLKNVARGERILLGSTTVRVEEFLPDRLKIRAWLSQERKDGWISPDNLKGLVNLQNLFGTPAVDHRATATLTLTPGRFAFSKYPNHCFSDPLAGEKHHLQYHREDLPPKKTDENGDANFDFDLKRFEKGAWWLNFIAQGFEAESGRSVTAGSGVLVSSLGYLIGYKPDGELGYVSKDSQRFVDIIAVNSTLDAVTVSDLQIKVIERRHLSVLTRRQDGNYVYQSVVKEHEVSARPFSIPKEGVKFSIPTDTAGDFVARIFDPQQLRLSEIGFSVVGHGNLTRSLERNAELKVKIPRKEWHTGEEIEVHITAPYTGAGLITIERDKVHAFQWFKTQTTSSIQRIRVPDHFEGGGYLNITFVRALDSKEIFMSPLSYAVVPFTVNRDKRKVSIDLDVPEKALPGQPLTIGYKADRPTKLVVYAVDEGILQVARYDLPDPLGYFFRKAALQVRTSQILDLILPEYSVVRQVAAAGGDAGMELLGKNLNPFKRKTDLPVAFWSGIIEAGLQPKQVIYQVPDHFSGTLRVMAVAVAPAAVGSAQKKCFIKGPFVINPNVPTFLAPGDIVDISVSVANNVEGSGSDIPVSLELKTSEALEVSGLSIYTLQIAEGRETVAHFLVKARAVLGNTDLGFVASGGSHQSSFTSHLSIRPPMPHMTSVKSGYFEKSTTDVEIERTLYPAFRHMQASVSPSPVGFCHGLNEYLQSYPYGCAEQVVSKAFPLLVRNDQLDFGLTKEQAEDQFRHTISLLRARQNEQGAFGYWYATVNTLSGLTSTYAMHFLTEAREQGFAVPSDMFSRGLGYLEKMAVEEPGNLDEARIRAKAIYLLTRNGMVTTSYLVHLQQYLEKQHAAIWRNDTAGAYVAATYKMLKKDIEAEQLISAFQPTTHIPEGVALDYDFNTSLTRNAQYIALLAKHFPQRLKKLGPDSLQSLVRALSDGNFNTHSAAWCILALHAYSRVVDVDDVADLSINEMDVSGNLLSPLAGEPPPSGKNYLIHSFSEYARKLRFTGQNRNAAGLKGLFYQITQSGFDRQLPEKPMKEGLEVQREFRDKSNHVINHTTLGAQVEVHLKVRTLERQTLSNVAVIDLLPGGFEVVTESIRGEGGSFVGTENVDIREDRVVFFGTFHRNASEIVYRIKATNKGRFVVPPAFAESMYNPSIRSCGIAGKIIVEAGPR